MREQKNFQPLNKSESVPPLHNPVEISELVGSETVKNVDTKKEKTTRLQNVLDHLTAENLRFKIRHPEAAKMSKFYLGSAVGHALLFLMPLLSPKQDMPIQSRSSNGHFVEMVFDRNEEGANESAEKEEVTEKANQEGRQKRRRVPEIVEENLLENSDVVWGVDDGESGPVTSQEPIDEKKLSETEQKKFKEKERLERVAQQVFERYKQQLIAEFSSEFGQPIDRATFLEFQEQLIIFQHVAWQEAQHQVSQKTYDVNQFFTEAEQKFEELQSFLKPHRDHLARLKNETEVFDYIASVLSTVPHLDKNPSPLHFREGVNCVGKFHMAAILGLSVDRELYLRVGAEVSKVDGTGHIAVTLNDYVINPNSVEKITNPNFIHDGDLYKSLLGDLSGGATSGSAGDRSGPKEIKEYNGFSPTGPVSREKKTEKPKEVRERSVVEQEDESDEVVDIFQGVFQKERFEKIKELPSSSFRTKALNIYTQARSVPEGQRRVFIRKKTIGLRKRIVRDIFEVQKRPSLAESIRKLSFAEFNQFLPEIQVLDALSDGLDYFGVNTNNAEENRVVLQKFGGSIDLYPTTSLGIEPNTKSPVYLDRMEYFNPQTVDSEKSAVNYYITIENLEKLNTFVLDTQALIRVDGFVRTKKDLLRLAALDSKKVMLNFNIDQALDEVLWENPDQVDMSSVEACFEETSFSKDSRFFLNYKKVYFDGVDLAYISKNLSKLKARTIVIRYDESEYSQGQGSEVFKALQSDPRITLIKKKDTK